MDHFYSLREQFFSFFEKRGHVPVPSSSLIPDDQSVLLTTAGMQQFKPYYTQLRDAKKDFSSQRVVSIQKCFRTTDFDEVGDDTHLTFFEMMGNFSFAPLGDDNPASSGTDGYFKTSAILWGYEYITQELGIDPSRIHVTIFSGDNTISRDEEAYRIWKDVVGIDPSRIREGGREDNFWGPTGIEGPCGPTTEIYVDGVEVWNIVFNEYYARMNEGSLEFEKSSTPGIDTGMGFERLLSLVEKKPTFFETSAFFPSMQLIRTSAPHLSVPQTRIIADHMRGSIFLIGDGVLPSNKEAGYVLRRLLRRLIALAIQEGLEKELFTTLQQQIINQYSPLYPELSFEQTQHVWNEEYNRFKESITKGLKELEKHIEKKDVITAHDAFYIYETFGVPFDVIRSIVPQEKQKNFSYTDFEKAHKEHQNISRAGSEKKFGGHGLLLNTGELKAENKEELEKVIRSHTATHLLQAALRKVRGESIMQMGSDITAKRLRFDFSAEEKLTPEELQHVEALVQQYIQEDLPVTKEIMKKEDALKSGALHFFKEQYPDEVTVYTIGEGDRIVSKEFCGGPHVQRTSEIGSFHITKHESVGRGIKRIRAILA